MTVTDFGISKPVDEMLTGQALLDAHERRVLERAALAIEHLEGNSLYRQAWRRAANAIRRMKPD